jgi:hypothetical protein
LSGYNVRLRSYTPSASRCRIHGGPIETENSLDEKGSPTSGGRFTLQDVVDAVDRLQFLRIPDDGVEAGGLRAGIHSKITLCRT